MHSHQNNSWHHYNLLVEAWMQCLQENKAKIAFDQATIASKFGFRLSFWQFKINFPFSSNNQFRIFFKDLEEHIRGKLFLNGLKEFFKTVTGPNWSFKQDSQNTYLLSHFLLSNNCFLIYFYIFVRTFLFTNSICFGPSSQIPKTQIYFYIPCC